ncbi:hypothetical protein PMAYCL1PPCAC_29593, partial [Pristionchus mayeri]
PALICYTDGSCQVVGGRGISSGIGLFFHHLHPLNTSKRLNGPRHESGIAEILAVQTALKKIHRWEGFRNEPVIIRTDYMGIIDAMVNGNDGRFSEMYDDLRRSAEKFPSGVTFEFVSSHDGEEGNEMADRLARETHQSRSEHESEKGRRVDHSQSMCPCEGKEICH